MTAGTSPVTGHRSARAPIEQRQLLLSLGLGLWMVVGLFLDGWAHDDGGTESFFTPWHAVLYSGFSAAATAAIVVARRAQRPGTPWVSALPLGHGLTLVGLAIFASGGLGDLAWHELLGIELGVEALLSPSHLLLLAGGLLVLSAPFRAAWSNPGPDPDDLRAQLPVIGALALLVGLAGFFLVYVSPFANDAGAARFDRLPGAVHAHPSTDAAELGQLLGIASVLVTTVLLAVPVHLFLRRWRPRPGSCTALLGLSVTLLVALDTFEVAPVVLAGVLAGATADWLLPRTHPAVAVGVATTVLWLAYFGIYETAGPGVAWSAELWTGTTAVAGLIAAGVGLLRLAPPADEGVGAPMSIPSPPPDTRR